MLLTIALRINESERYSPSTFYVSLCPCSRQAQQTNMDGLTVNGPVHNWFAVLGIYLGHRESTTKRLL